MAKIYPGDGLQRQAAVARVLLNIVGTERAAEIQTRTTPLHFEVPDDVSVEYERRLREAAEARAAAEAKRAEAPEPAPKPEPEPEPEPKPEPVARRSTARSAK